MLELGDRAGNKTVIVHGCVKLTHQYNELALQFRGKPLSEAITMAVTAQK